MRAVLTASMHIFWVAPARLLGSNGRWRGGGRGRRVRISADPRTPRKYSLIPRRYRPGGMVSRRDSPRKPVPARYRTVWERQVVP